MTSEFLQIEPQPARGKFDPSMWTDPHYICEEKWDGFRLVGQVCNGMVRFTTRRISTVTGHYQERTPQVPHLAGLASSGCYQTVRPPRALEGTILDGEVIPADYLDALKLGGVSKKVGSIITSEPELAVEKQIERGWLRYVVFDCLRYKGKDLRGLALRGRREFMHRAIEEWDNPWATLTDAEPCGPARRGEKMLQRIFARNGEGVILKHLDAVYGAEKTWIKVKKERVADVVIIGFKEAKAETKKKSGEVSRSRIAGKVGSVEIGQYKGGKLVSVGFARGFGDALMQAFTDYPEKYEGKVITIEANDREPTGKFRHPRVTDPVNPFRSDKRAKDCLFDLNEA